MRYSQIKYEEQNKIKLKILKKIFRKINKIKQNQTNTLNYQKINIYLKQNSQMGWKYIGYLIKYMIQKLVRLRQKEATTEQSGAALSAVQNEVSSTTD